MGWFPAILLAIMARMGIQSTKDECSDFSRLGNYLNREFAKKIPMPGATGKEGFWSAMA
jgi:hypothetical protein